MSPDLLWRAWPEGYLAMRGVSTLGKWTCIEANQWTRFRAINDPHEVLVRGDSHDVDSVSHVLRLNGDLLPNVDPTDTATWACLKLDLGCAANPQLAAEDWTERDSLFWSRNWSARDAGTGWVLGNCFGVIRFFPGIDTDDPAEALVLARVQLSEGKDGD